MNSVNKTLYIPLYGKAFVSRKSLFLKDKKAEQIWETEGFALKGKSKSKWLAYYMGIRSAVFDEWTKQQLMENKDAVVVHIGCGMDSRAERIGAANKWYDVDFPEVIKERAKYYAETDRYKMIGADARDGKWLAEIAKAKCAVVVMEGVSMYLTAEELKTVTTNLCGCFEQVCLLMDCYTVMAAKMSKYKNPVKDVGVATVYGTDNPKTLQEGDFVFVKEHEMTPQKYIDQLSGFEKTVFSKLYAGGFSKKLYRMFEYKKAQKLSVE